MQSTINFPVVPPCPPPSLTCFAGSALASGRHIGRMAACELAITRLTGPNAPSHRLRPAARGRSAPGCMLALWSHTGATSSRRLADGRPSLILSNSSVASAGRHGTSSAYHGAAPGWACCNDNASPQLPISPCSLLASCRPPDPAQQRQDAEKCTSQKTCCSRRLATCPSLVRRQDPWVSASSLGGQPAHPFSPSITSSPSSPPAREPRASLFLSLRLPRARDFGVLSARLAVIV